MPPKKTHFANQQAPNPHPNAGYPQQGFNQYPHPNAGYPQQGFNQYPHPNAGYPQQNFNQYPYPNAGYPQQNFNQYPYPNAGYPQPGYHPHGQQDILPIPKLPSGSKPAVPVISNDSIKPNTLPFIPNSTPIINKAKPNTQPPVKINSSTIATPKIDDSKKEEKAEKDKKELDTKILIDKISHEQSAQVIEAQVQKQEQKVEQHGDNLILNPGGGDCGIYAIIDALKFVNHEAAEKLERDNYNDIQTIRNKICKIVENFFPICDFANELKKKSNETDEDYTKRVDNADYLKLKNYYKDIFGDNNFIIFKKIILAYIDKSLNTEDIKQENSNSFNALKNSLSNIQAWKNLKREALKGIFTKYNTLNIDIDSILKGHSKSAVEYYKYASQGEIWLNNDEINAYLLTLGFIAETQKNDVIAGICTQYVNVSSANQVIYLYNNTHNNGLSQGDSGIHWMAAKSNLISEENINTVSSSTTSSNNLSTQEPHKEQQSLAPVVLKTNIDKVISKNGNPVSQSSSTDTKNNKIKNIEPSKVEKSLKDQLFEDFEQLLKAINDKDKEKINELIKKNPQIIFEKDGDDNTPLHLVAAENHVEILQLLITAKADYAAKNKDGKTPLHMAVYMGHTEVVKMLIEAVNNDNANVIDTTTNDGDTPLHIAVERSRIAVIKMLINANADDNIKNKNGYAPLHLAIQMNNNSAVKALLTAHADVKVHDKDGNTPLHMAVDMAVNKGSKEIIQLFIDSKANLNAFDSKNKTPLHLAIEMNSIEVMWMLINADADVNAAKEDCDAPLHLAIQMNNNLAVKALLTAHANVKIHNKDGKTPLHMAVNQGSKEIVQLLIAAGTDINASGSSSNTLLHIAIDSASEEIVQLLISAGADIEAKDINNETPLRKAASKGREKIVKTLIDRGSNIDAKSQQENTPLHMAALSGHKNVVELLINESTNKNPNLKSCSQKNKSGETPLHCAALGGNYDTVDYLIKKDPAVVMAENCTLLHMTAFGRFHKYNESEAFDPNIYRDIADLLLKHNPDSVKSLELFHVIAKGGNVEILKLVIDKLSPEDKHDFVLTDDEDGNIPLHKAAEYLHVDMVNYLIELNNDSIYYLNNQNLTPLHFALNRFNNYFYAKNWGNPRAKVIKLFLEKDSCFDNYKGFDGINRFDDPDHSNVPWGDTIVLCEINKIFMHTFWPNPYRLFLEKCKLRLEEACFRLKLENASSSGTSSEDLLDLIASMLSNLLKNNDLLKTLTPTNLEKKLNYLFQNIEESMANVEKKLNHLFQNSVIEKSKLSLDVKKFIAIKETLKKEYTFKIEESVEVTSARQNKAQVTLLASKVDSKQDDGVTTTTISSSNDVQTELIELLRQTQKQMQEQKEQMQKQMAVQNQQMQEQKEQMQKQMAAQNQQMQELVHQLIKISNNSSSGSAITFEKTEQTSLPSNEHSIDATYDAQISENDILGVHNG